MRSWCCCCCYCWYCNSLFKNTGFVYPLFVGVRSGWQFSFATARARRCINRYCLATRFTVYLDALSLADGRRTISQPTSPPFLLPPFPTQPQPMPLPVSLGFLECLACFFGLLNIALN